MVGTCGEQFTLEAAAEGLAQMWEVLLDPDRRKQQAHHILEWSAQGAGQTVAEALRKGEWARYQSRYAEHRFWLIHGGGQRHASTEHEAKGVRARGYARGM